MMWMIASAFMVLTIVALRHALKLSRASRVDF
jgi:hypothetical protein